MDFGLAKMLEEVRRQTTVVGGTPFYVAPEQVMGDEVDGRADLYSLGISLFELLTGDVPFREGDVTHHHRHTPPPDPREREATIPDALAELILEMLEKDRENRPADADEVRERLEPFTQG
ncbi:MAG: protein kinase [Deltaproteobacteria bacterium]|nr:protein kinase [Deltaproteobacteria bacterium]